MRVSKRPWMGCAAHLQHAKRHSISARKGGILAGLLVADAYRVVLAVVVVTIEEVEVSGTALLICRATTFAAVTQAFARIACVHAAATTLGRLAQKDLVSGILVRGVVRAPLLAFGDELANVVLEHPISAAVSFLRDILHQNDVSIIILRVIEHTTLKAAAGGWQSEVLGVFSQPLPLVRFNHLEVCICRG